MAELLGVSRSSIRDAIRRLELVGLVEPRQGAGAVVREVSAASFINPLSNALVHKRPLVSELLDFRKMLEPPLAARGHAPTPFLFENVRTEISDSSNRTHRSSLPTPLCVG